VTPAGIGRNILADRDFGRLMSATTPGDHWLLLAANGLYSFKGTAFVRGGTFDRIQLVQGEKTIRFQRDDYRLVEALPAGQPNFREMGLFRVPKDAGFDATKPWRLEFAVPALGLDGSPRSLRLELDYTLPKRFIRLPPTMEPEVQVQRQVISTSSPDLWQATWLANMGKITITIIALSAMMVVLILQDQIVRRPELYRWLRNGFLAFTLVWLGWYAIAQLSVVNVVTFVHALLSGFRWDFFLLEPVIFLEWSFVALALLFWGRGVFCGWLCPFGALQELTHYLARLLRLPQFQVNFLIHERLWAVKYVLFLVILALSLNFTEIAIAAAEVEPFKTAVAMRFVRSWPFLIYAIGLLVAGLFVERFFCRYLCPLGAAIAIPARIRMFEWLKRRPQCGSQCQACAQKCPVQAIHPDGKINPNECIYCLNCQMLHYNDRVCPPLVERRQKREARAAKLKELMAKPATATEAKA
ncbi:MAG: 4Fe-4S binding protein, partial [Alphaproteobacteria bacterium]|nr:4Fe-4S binding protein [Alphaproteobacteria bacterium]